MDQLQTPFAAGSLAWVQLGPSRHDKRPYGQLKISVLLGKTTGRLRLAGQSPWRRLAARSTGVCVGDLASEIELNGEGQFFALQLDHDYLGKAWAAIAPAERSLYDVYGATDPYLFHLAAEATARLRRQQELSPRYVESVAHLATVHVRERYLSRRPQGRERPAAALSPHAQARVLTHIRERLAEKLPLAELAAVAGISTSHFARAFRHSVGETPHRFILRQRLEHSLQLLRGHGGLPLVEAAFQTGFSSQSHFTRCFRACYGLTPGEFLRKERPETARM